MPLYEYECPECKKIVVEMHKMDEKPNILCKDCNVAMNKIISVGGFILTGDGYYKPGHN